MSDLHLYSYKACPFARRTRITLREKGIDFELTEIDLQNKPANFHEISPYGKVPVLLHGTGRIYESAIINQYLDEAFPAIPLLPEDPMLRAQARIWMDYCDSRLSAASWKYMQARKDDEKRPAALEALRECLRFIEHEGLEKLSAGPYWLGESLSLVDIQYLPFFQQYLGDGKATDEIPADCGRIRSWLELMSARDSVRATAPA